MDQQSQSAGALKSKRSFRIIALTCLLAGTLDILSAIIDSSIRYKISPVLLFQYIASGVLGKAAFSGGLTTAAAGLIFHYFIASCWTVLFFLVFPKLKLPSKYKIGAGLIYGIIIWLIMNLIVVPLSKTQKIPFNLGHAIMGMLYLMFMIGLPVSLVFYKYYSTQA